MMGTLLMRLDGPMQAWGSDSRFETRRTGTVPTKSGVIGMLASALGRKRNECIEDLSDLKFGVRVDQEGKLLKDFHTAGSGTKKPYVTTRYYLCDAVFLVGVESDDFLRLKELEVALTNPKFPLFLGRRSCPVTLPLCLGIRDTNLIDSLLREPLLSSAWMQRKKKHDKLSLRIYTDQGFGGRNAGMQRDFPKTFNVSKRIYEYRAIEEHNLIDVPKAFHDPMKILADVEFDVEK